MKQVTIPAYTPIWTDQTGHYGFHYPTSMWWSSRWDEQAIVLPYIGSSDKRAVKLLRYDKAPGIVWIDKETLCNLLTDCKEPETPTLVNVR